MDYFNKIITSKIKQSKFILLVWLLIVTYPSYTQTPIIDSIKYELKKVSHDTVKCRLLYELVQAETNEEIWPVYNNQLMQLAEKNARKSYNNHGLFKLYSSYLAHAIHDKGTLYISCNKKYAENCLLKSLKLREKTDDKKGLIESLTSLGLFYNGNGNARLSLDYLYKGLKISEQIKDISSIGRFLICIGSVYDEQGLDHKALEHYFSGLSKFREINETEGISIILNNIGMIYSDLQEHKTALEYYYKSLKLSESMHEKSSIAATLNNIAVVFLNQGNLHKAHYFYTRSLKLFYETNSKASIAKLLNNIGHIYLLQKKYNKAHDYSSRSLTISQQLGYPSDIMSASKTLYKIYSDQKKPVEALAMYELYIKMKDSIYNEEVKEATFKSQFKYEYEKKSLADSLKTAAETKLNNEKLKQEKTQRFALYAGLLIVLVFAGFMFNRFRVTQKQKNIITQQKSIVDESQRKIMDSINYAKKIQYSILPSTDEISHYFPEHFIIFQPKDIVSGDFYWFHHQNDLSFFAVADCTGHGVPGALMTMVAHSILIEIVMEQKLTSPDKILSSLHQSVFKTLQQQKGDEYSQDGLDISFCVIDHKNNLLHFSGARNNAYLTDGREIRTLKATSKSIGGLSLLGETEATREFKLETVSYDKKMLLVLTTDGFLDQLDENDEKFGTNRLKSQILEMHSIETQNITPVLETAYFDWKRSAPQLDDILLAGMRF